MSETNNINPFGNSHPDFKSVNSTTTNNLNDSDSQPQKKTDLTTETEVDLKSINQSEATQKTQNIDWHKIAHKLREHNRKLLKQVFQLEQEVAETNNRIEEHKVRSQNTDMLIAQQAEEINQNQEEIAYLRQELETSGQKVYSQQVLVNSLTKQSETTNEKFAQIERDCSSLQGKYDRQTHDLILKTQQIQELSARLNRQQRYTLQYKAALDEYLDVASSGSIATKKFDSDLHSNHPQPVQSWSQILTKKETVPPLTSSNLELRQKEELTTSKAETILNSKNAKKPNWPSPVIASNNNHNKPQSLAAVKLPKFQSPDET